MKKKHIIELKFYRYIGVTVFKKFVLWLDYLSYAKYGRMKNNYHIRCSDSVGRFKWYLLYNSFIHSVSLGLIVLYFVVTRYSGYIFLVLDILMGFTTVLNLYCIFLQRYNYIRVDYYEKQCVKRKSWHNKYDVSTKTVMENFEKQELLDVDLLLQQIRYCLKSDKSLLLNNKNIPTLDCLSEILNRVGFQYAEPSKKDEHIFNETSNIDDYIDTCIIQTEQYGQGELRINWILKYIWKKDRRITDRPTLVTFNPETEISYRKVFRKDRVADVLDEIILSEVHNEEAN